MPELRRITLQNADSDITLMAEQGAEGSTLALYRGDGEGRLAITLEPDVVALLAEFLEGLDVASADE